MFLKRRTRTKDGKTHVYYSVCESLRVSRNAVVQRHVLHLGELNTTQIDSWQRSIDVLHDDGQRRQLRLFTDRDHSAPNDPDVVEVKLSSFAVKSPRRFGDCWSAFQLWCDLGLDSFWRDALAKDAGDVPWDKVLALLVVNRLLSPRSELFVGFPNRRWTCCWMPTRVWRTRIGSIAVWIGCWRTSRPWNNTWRRSGKTSSARASICYSTI
jgi:hypothetical protein